ncbi:hypothetical protein I79_010379 [Cricetulus griseus]|uniref:Uncharacterized protein n=1 Tax=Cricetulus griseus TaxID=10029 RepID=G3HIB1_CRIGR|nr:hypothetical protein I79_010379 [Cricetulus griseus]
MGRGVFLCNPGRPSQLHPQYPVLNCTKYSHIFPLISLKGKCDAYLFTFTNTGGSLSLRPVWSIWFQDRLKLQRNPASNK